MSVIHTSPCTASGSSSRSSGFTLIEMATVILILSLIIAGALAGYKLYLRQLLISQQTRVELEVQAALSRFLFMNGRLPCPADASLARTDRMYGRENCAPPGPTLVRHGGGPVPPSGGCTVPTVGGLCISKTVGANATMLRRGMIPFATLEIDENKAYDAYSMRMTYIVNMRQTDVNTYKVSRPYITAGPNQDESGIDLRDIATFGGAELPLLPGGRRADFVVMSSGQNRVGSFPRNGTAGASNNVTWPGGVAYAAQRMTTIPIPCTAANTGGPAEAINCDITSNMDPPIIYAGAQNHARGNPIFLDDHIAYFLFNDVNSWRASTADRRDVVLRDSAGLVGINKSTATLDRLDMNMGLNPTAEALKAGGGLYICDGVVGPGCNAANKDKICNALGVCESPTSLWENVIRTTGAMLTKDPVNGKICDANNNCFNPADLAGDPDIGFGKIKCANAGWIVAGIKGNGSNLVPICIHPSGKFCDAPKRLKGFNPGGTPICVDPANVACPPKTVSLCTENANNAIAYRVNIGLSATGAIGAGGNPLAANDRAWLDSALTGLDPRRNLPPTINGAAATVVTTRTVQQKNNTDTCNALFTASKISNRHRITSNWQGTTDCRYGFNGGTRTETWQCDSGAWLKIGETGRCVEACTPIAYPETKVPCDTIAWTHANMHTKVTLQGVPGPFPKLSDWRAGIDTRTMWTGDITIPPGASCGGVPPAPTGPGANTCGCTNPVNLKQSKDVDCPTGYKVKAALPGGVAVDFNTFKQTSEFSCGPCAGGAPTPSDGDWCPFDYTTVTACECDPATPAQDTAYTCIAGTTPSVAPAPAYRKTWSCPLGWGASSPVGSCGCTATPVVTNAFVQCNQNHPPSGWVGNPNTFGQVQITITTTKQCDGVPPMGTAAFYPSGVPGTTNVTYTNDGGANCLPMNSTWKASSAPSGPFAAGGTQLGTTCIGVAEQTACQVALCGGAPCVQCPVEAPKPCFSAAGAGLWTRYDTCNCSN